MRKRGRRFFSPLFYWVSLPYGYVQNDPVNYIDPEGLFDISAGFNSVSKATESSTHLKKAASAKEAEYNVYRDMLSGKLTDTKEINKRIKEASMTSSSERKKGYADAIDSVISAIRAVYGVQCEIPSKSQ